MVQLPHIASFCRETSLSNTVQQYLVPMLINYLGDENIQVRKSSHSALLSLVEQKLIDIDTVTERICPLVLHLTDSIHPEDLRTESIVLMSKLAVLLGKKAAEEIFLDRLFSLCTDKSNNIRKACASTFGDFCTTVGKETTEEVLLQKFFSLCRDSAWCVRKACTENFMPVSCVVSRETRCKELASLYMVLLSDQSRWVRLTAYQALGPFISTFAEPEKTGLYYSKDGILTVVDAPHLQVQEEPLKSENNDDTTNVKLNGDCTDLETVNSISNCSVDMKNSSKPCDSVVPQSSTETTLSASEASGISCHVDNDYCTVIEVSSPTMTSPSASKDIESNVVTDYPKENGWDSESIINNSSVNDKSLLDICNNTTLLNRKCYKSANANDKAYSKLWYEIVYGNDDGLTVSKNDLVKEINGDCNIMESDSIDLQNSEVESALLSSITVNGINISSSVALAGPMNCEVIPVVTCSMSSEKKTLNESVILNDSCIQNEIQSDTNQHSIEVNSKDQDILNASTDAQVNCIQDLSHIPSHTSLNSEKFLELKVTNSESYNESAFNYFQYWRTPLPEIDVEDMCKDLCDDDTTKCNFNYSEMGEYNHSNKISEKNAVNNLKLNESFIQTVNVNVVDDLFDDANKSATDDQASENKEGEPPPGSKQISVHDQDIVPPELLLTYLSMIDAAWAQTIDAEIARHCAYSLPAVALTLGRKFWPCLKETFDALSSDLQGFIMMWKVRRTVASSMHQLAVILGPDITSSDLLPVFSRFITDLDEVRIGILQHMSEFLEVLRPEERREFLPSLSEFLVSNSDTDNNEKNWRFRLILAEQLVSIADLYDPQDVRDHLVPLSLTLIRDKICEVRLAAVRVMAAVMRRMSQSPTTDLTKAVLSELTEKFIHAPKWLHRQLYVYICQEFIVANSLPPDQFAEDALPQLLYLGWDRVPNVRIAIARCLAVVIWPLDSFSNPDSPHRELLLQTIHTLQSDSDADVRYYANMVSTHECSCLQHADELASLLPV